MKQIKTKIYQIAQHKKNLLYCDEISIVSRYCAEKAKKQRREYNYANEFSMNFPLT